MPELLMDGSNEEARQEFDELAGTLRDERAGRSLVRDLTKHHEHLIETKQLPSPCATPPVDPFPKLEIIAATPKRSNNRDERSDEAMDGPGQYATSSDIGEAPEAASSSGLSSNNSSDDSSSSAIDDAPEPSTDTSTETLKAVETSPPRSRAQSNSKKDVRDGIIRKLSASQMQALAASPDSLPIAIVPPLASHNSHRKPNGSEYPLSAGAAESASRSSMSEQLHKEIQNNLKLQPKTPTPSSRHYADSAHSHVLSEPNPAASRPVPDFRRPPPSSRTLSTPPINRRPSAGPPVTEPNASRRYSVNPVARPAPLSLGSTSTARPGPQRHPTAHVSDDVEYIDHDELSPVSAIHPSIPVPPMSLHTHLQLELAGARPSPLYIYRQQTADLAYESSAVKFERLLNALLLPPYLESALTFGALACLDAFLYTFTLLPLRVCIAIGVLLKWWVYMCWKEARWVVGYVWQGSWRLWRRGRRGRSTSRTTRNRADSSQTTSEVERSQSRAREKDYASDATATSAPDAARLNGNGNFHLPPKHSMPRSNAKGFLRHRRTKSVPSNLTSYHKADLLQGAVIICSSLALMRIDASRMYHFIRAQSTMKLYVIYNLLEVGDRLLGAIGQDILECLFSSETLSRNSSGRSKLLLPFGMFILAAVYNVIHAMCLFYQVITLNVAVNSYSNALMTLILSNQFVEIKGSVFKKIEKENLFQLTCADVVERFQLWIILIIIAMRNIAEVGGFSIPGAGSETDGVPSGSGPLYTSSSLPASFTLLPSWLLSGEVLSPFFIVIGSEMLVDWIKHAYINKFNNVHPTIYRRMLDIFCKDYYTNAFGAPALTRRIGLPLLPLSCLFIRASVQIYHMFLATHLPPPIPTSTTELSLESSGPSSPAMTAALDRLDHLIRNALGRAVYGPPEGPPTPRSFWNWTSDDAVALLTMVIFFFLAWVVLLVFKLILGMVLLRFARERYAAMKLQEQPPTTSQEKPKRESYYQPGKRVGGWGHIEVGEDRRRMLYADDPEGLKRMKDREMKGEDASRKMNTAEDGLERVTRYEMIAKRIW